MTSIDTAARGEAALDAGRWAEARACFEASIGEGDTASARLGLARALWWLGENQASVDQSTVAYGLFRNSADAVGAVDCALWLAITYKANFDNFAAANGWIARAERLLESVEPGPPHAWAWLTRAYRMTDLDAAAALTERALDLARHVGDVNLELVAASQLGLISVGQGETERGFALIDESMAAALGGEPSDLQTVVYTCCDMLTACALAGDTERAAQWCRVADRFVEAYGCPFLYAECRIHYGSVLISAGRWDDAERELSVGVRMTADTCPSLHRKALQPARRSPRPPGTSRGRRHTARRDRREHRGGGRRHLVGRGVTPRPWRRSRGESLARASVAGHRTTTGRSGDSTGPACRRPVGRRRPACGR